MKLNPQQRSAPFEDIFIFLTAQLTCECRNTREIEKQKGENKSHS
jgi:hypothetical protein